MRLGRVARAAGIFESICETYPDFEPAYCHRIAAYTELGQHDRAEEMFYRAQDLNESCPHCFFNIAESLAMRGETDRAIYCWQKVLDLEPNYMGVNRRIAQAYRAAGEPELARDYFLRDLRDDPGNIELMFELAELSLESSDLSQAAAKFAHIVDLYQDHTEARSALGKIWLVQGDAQAALDSFEAIEAIEPNGGDLPEFNRRVGEALFQLGRHAEANRRFLAACEEDPENADLLMIYGTSLIGDQKLGEAEACFRRVLAVDDDHAMAHHSLSVCLLQRERYYSGLTHCLRAIELRPESVVSRCNAAVAMMRLGRWSQAQRMLDQAIRLEPRNTVVTGLRRRIWRYRLSNLWRMVRGWFGRNR